MSIEVDNLVQGSPEWQAVRIGVLTASKFSDAMAKGQGKVRRSLMLTMCAEILTGEPEESFTSEWIERGTELEPQARMAYEMVSNNTARQVGFVYLDKHKAIGCSPDGLVGDDGGLEIKCPKPKTHIENILAGKIPSDYVAQVQGSLWVTGRKWWDFVSFCPQIADNPIVIFRIEPQPDYIEKMRTELGQFLADLAETLEEIRRK